MFRTSVTSPGPDDQPAPRERPASTPKRSSELPLLGSRLRARTRAGALEQERSCASARRPGGRALRGLRAPRPPAVRSPALVALRLEPTGLFFPNQYLVGREGGLSGGARVRVAPACRISA